LTQNIEHAPRTTISSTTAKGQTQLYRGFFTIYPPEALAVLIAGGVTTHAILDLGDALFAVV